MRPPWLALIHQLPPTPAYVRVKIRRRLHNLGAFALKQSVYLLPNTDEHLEDFQWLREEILAEGGTAVIAEMTLVGGVTDAEITAGRRKSAKTRPSPKTSVSTVRPGRTWVTRQDVGVDRITSAWLIRRFIDPKARFRFVPARNPTLKRGEIGFDMTGVQYTHTGNACTFETLLDRFGLADRGLRRLGEMVHDLDMKDGRFGHPGTRRLAAIVRGVAGKATSDRARLAAAREPLDALLDSLQD